MSLGTSSQRSLTISEEVVMLIFMTSIKAVREWEKKHIKKLREEGKSEEAERLEREKEIKEQYICIVTLGLNLLLGAAIVFPAVLRKIIPEIPDFMIITIGWSFLLLTLVWFYFTAVNNKTRKKFENWVKKAFTHPKQEERP